jgi:hypothetical protein
MESESGGSVNVWSRLFPRLEPVSADIRTGLGSREGIPPGKSLVRPETGEAFSAAPAALGVTETALSRVSGGKAVKSQRLFQRRQETANGYEQ